MMNDLKPMGRADGTDADRLGTTGDEVLSAARLLLDRDGVRVAAVAISGLIVAMPSEIGVSGHLEDR
jgi:hypothetical protein